MIRFLRGLSQNLKNFTDTSVKTRNALFLKALLRQIDLKLQKILERDSLSYQRLRVKRRFGQTRQGVGFEIDRALFAHDEVGSRIAAARQRFVRPKRLLLRGTATDGA